MTHSKDAYEETGVPSKSVKKAEDTKVDFALVETKVSRARVAPEQGVKIRSCCLSAGLKRRFGHLCDDT